MPEIPLKYVKHVGSRVYLRVYWGTIPEDKVKEHGDWSYHDAKNRIYDVITTVKDPTLAIHEVSAVEYNNYLGKWPTKCDHCNESPPPYEASGVNYHVFYDELYDNPPRILQVGDVWDSPWMHNSPDCWSVRLPNNLDWFTWMVASNCTHDGMIEKDANGKVTLVHPHKCWTVNGTPPDLDVSPSIQMDKGGSRDWHGHIQNGKLVW